MLVNPSFVALAPSYVIENSFPGTSVERTCFFNPTVSRAESTSCNTLMGSVFFEERLTMTSNRNHQILLTINLLKAPPAKRLSGNVWIHVGRNQLRPPYTCRLKMSALAIVEMINVKRSMRSLLRRWVRYTHAPQVIRSGRVATKLCEIALKDARK